MFFSYFKINPKVLRFSKNLSLFVSHDCTSKIKQTPWYLNTRNASSINFPKFVPIKDNEKMHKSTELFSTGNFDISQISTNSLNLIKSKDRIRLKILSLLLLIKCYYILASPQPRSKHTLFTLLVFKIIFVLLNLLNNKIRWLNRPFFCLLLIAFMIVKEILLILLKVIHWSIRVVLIHILVQ